jgi:hypothetical protein
MVNPVNTSFLLGTIMDGRTAESGGLAAMVHAAASESFSFSRRTRMRIGAADKWFIRNHVHRERRREQIRRAKTHSGLQLLSATN